MEPFLVSTLVVALAEIGDKTQLLAIVLATRFRKPLPIIAGIFLATAANHALAALAGFFLTDMLSGTWFKYAVAVSFIAMALWALVPDKCDEIDDHRAQAGVFLTTFVAFFLVEIGDKTQVATAALAARFHNVELVTAGTTIGMMLANVPAVYLGEAATRIIPLTQVRFGAAMIFLALGLLGLADAANLQAQLAHFELPAGWALSLLIAIVLSLNVLTFVISADRQTDPASRSPIPLAASIAMYKFLAPLSGWAIGFAFATALQPVDHWIAFVLLGATGTYALYSALMLNNSHPMMDRGENSPAGLSFDALIAGLIIGLLGEGGIITTAAMLGTLSFAIAVLVGSANVRLPLHYCCLLQMIGGAFIAMSGAAILYLHVS